MHAHIHIIGVALYLTFVLTGIGFAQQPPPPPKPREAKAEFALVSTSGNTSAQSIGAAAQVIFRPAQWELDGQTTFVRNEADDVVSAKSFAARGRAGRIVNPRLQVFGQHGYLRDLFSGIVHRNLTEGGLSYLVVQAGRNTLYADAGLGYLKERRTLGASLSTPTAGGGTRYKLRFSETSDLTDDLTLSFDLAEDGTWRLQHVIALTARVAAPLSLKVSNLLRYVDEPVQGFDETDTITSAALVLTF